LEQIQSKTGRSNIIANATSLDSFKQIFLFLFMDSPYCPKCKEKGRRSILSPVHAIPISEIQTINPIMPDIRQLQKIFSEHVIVDMGFCEDEHGIIFLKEKTITV